MDGTWFRRNLRWLLLDLLMAVAFATVFLVSAAKWSGAQPVPHRPVDALGYGLLLGIAAVLLVRRWAPRPALVVEATLVGFFVGVGYPEGPYFLTMAIVGLTVGRTSGRRGAAWAAIGATSLLAAGTVASFDRGYEGSGWGLVAGLTAALLVGTAPVVVGSLIREHQSWRATAKDEAQARLIDAERLRMAREVHDVVGHSLSIISLQAGVALHVLDRRPEQAQLSLEAIRRTSIDALDELRATLALTRAGRTMPGPPPGGDPLAGAPPRIPSAAAPPVPDDRSAAPEPRSPLVVPGARPDERAPLTGLGRLPGLLAEVRLCGVLVEAEISGPVDRLPAQVDLAAYRIVQESLTNVLRHARGASVAIRLRVDDAAVAIDVTDRPADEPSSIVAFTHGNGLTGLRERAAELGGELAAGPGDAGGWRVRARLPLPRAAIAGRTGASEARGSAGGGGDR
jgi:signal transduction histidine kinase